MGMCLSSVYWKLGGIYRGVLFPHLKANFVRPCLKYLLISSILLCNVLYWSEASSAHAKCAAILYCVDICNWINSSGVLSLD